MGESFTIRSCHAYFNAVAYLLEKPLCWGCLYDALKRCLGRQLTYILEQALYEVPVPHIV